MYQFEEKINYGSLFVFDKRWIKNMNWASLPKASKAIFPVILSHCNKKGLAFPSERRIAILSGRPDKSVRAGIKGLKGFPGFKVGSRITDAGRRGKLFHMKLPAIEQGKTFPFHRCIIYGGNWSQLKPTATALYLVMRHFSSSFDFDRYINEAGIEAGLDEFKEIYRDRAFDFCKADRDVLAEFAGIAQRSMGAALDNLEDKGLIEGICGDWKVFLIPPYRYKPAFSNKQIMDRYKHENKDGKKDR